MSIFGCFYYATQNKFIFPFIVSKYVTGYTFGKLYDWPIIHMKERVGYMQRMRDHRYNTCCLGRLSNLLIRHFVFSLRSVSVHFRPDYFKLPSQYFGKLNNSICESCYYTSSDSYNDAAGFFEVNISKLPSQFLPVSTARTTMVNDGVLEKFIKIKVLNIFDSFLFYFVANMYGYNFLIGHRDIQPLSNYQVAG